MNNFQGISRPRWTELWRLQNTAERDAAAGRLFGDRPARKGETPKPYRADQYQKQLGIDISQLDGFFVEVGHVDAPTGPVTPATERLPIEPILAIRQSRRGHYYPQGLSMPEGFFNREKTKAWVLTKQYDQLVGDDYFDRVQAQIDKVLEQAQQDDKKLRLVDLGALSTEERLVFAKLRDDKDFGELSQQERDVITNMLGRADQQDG